MTEIEQLRAELNELRERLAVLEKRPTPAPIDLMRFGGRRLPSPGVLLSDAAQLSIRSAMEKAAANPGTRVRCAISGQDLGSAD